MKSKLLVTLALILAQSSCKDSMTTQSQAPTPEGDKSFAAECARTDLTESQQVTFKAIKEWAKSEDCEKVEKVLSTAKVLDLSNKNLEDLSPLSLVGPLPELNLSGNNISNVEALRALTSLRYLNLGQNKLADVGPLGLLIQLQTLTLSDNPISNLSPLGTLTNLEFIFVGRVESADVTLDSTLPRDEEHCPTKTLSHPLNVFCDAHNTKAAEILNGVVN